MADSRSGGALHRDPPRTAAPAPHPVELAEGTRVRLDPRARTWANAAVLFGGSPWRVITLASPAQKLVLALKAAGSAGLALTDTTDLRAARQLLDRGFLLPIPHHHTSAPPEVVVPVFADADSLRDLISSMPTASILVVDDASPNAADITHVVHNTQAQLIRHDINRGPAAARNTGLRNTTSPIVAFIDADCVADPTWHTRLQAHFDDPRVAAAAPRILPIPGANTLLDRFEATRSALDMGKHAGLVQAGARPSFVPSAALLIRRAAVTDQAFDPELRLGEDVDLIWRLTEDGWLVRYEPSIVVHHKTRTTWRSWLKRRYEYGTSAADLDRRHPGNLTPLRSSPWNVAALSLLATGHLALGLTVSLGAAALLWRRLGSAPQAPTLAARFVAQGLIADAAAIGHLLRREWWPVGAVILAASPRSRTARYASLTIIGPIAWEWITTHPRVNPVSYTAIRLIEDAAYGSGVIASSIRSRTLRTLAPQIANWRKRARAESSGVSPSD